MRRVLFAIVWLIISLSIHAAPIRSALGAERCYEEDVKGPYDSEVEYLESKGYQYILVPCNVSYLRTSETSIEVKFKWPYRNHTHLFGYRTGSREYGVPYDRNKNLNILYGNTGCSLSGMYEDIHTILIIPSENIATVDDIQYQVSFNILNESSDTICIFGYYNTSTRAVSQLSMAAIYYFKIYDAETGELIYDLIPVRKNGEGFLYDKISGFMFRNQGRGSFIIGPDRM